jgi:methionyl-tRNA synthetase
MAEREVNTTTGQGGNAPQPPEQPAPILQPDPGPRIGIEDFLKVDLRVARIISAERVPKSRKLMKMEVDLGTDRRTLVAGIGESYEADALVGRLVGVVANLKPATLMGIESSGMVLAASAQGGPPVLVGFDTDVPLGARIK